MEHKKPRHCAWAFSQRRLCFGGQVAVVFIRSSIVVRRLFSHPARTFTDARDSCLLHTDATTATTTA
ncbi:MAG: hypothetical protein KDE50_04760, partial [Caldilineaceae bacterium]|nr:hypothetical protein [Caldilineaceae bacterium]